MIIHDTHGVYIAESNYYPAKSVEPTSILARTIRVIRNIDSAGAAGVRLASGSLGTHTWQPFRDASGELAGLLSRHFPSLPVLTDNAADIMARLAGCDTSDRISPFIDTPEATRLLKGEAAQDMLGKLLIPQDAPGDALYALTALAARLSETTGAIAGACLKGLPQHLKIDEDILSALTDIIRPALKQEPCSDEAAARACRAFLTSQVPGTTHLPDLLPTLLANQVSARTDILSPLLPGRTPEQSLTNAVTQSVPLSEIFADSSTGETVVTSTTGSVRNAASVTHAPEFTPSSVKDLGFVNREFSMAVYRDVLRGFTLNAPTPGGLVHEDAGAVLVPPGTSREFFKWVPHVSGRCDAPAAPGNVTAEKIFPGDGKVVPLPGRDAGGEAYVIKRVVTGNKPLLFTGVGPAGGGVRHITVGVSVPGERESFRIPRGDSADAVGGPFLPLLTGPDFAVIPPGVSLPLESSLGQVPELPPATVDGLTTALKMMDNVISTPFTLPGRWFGVEARATGSTLTDSRPPHAQELTEGNNNTDWESFDENERLDAATTSLPRDNSVDNKYYDAVTSNNDLSNYSRQKRNINFNLEKESYKTELDKLTHGDNISLCDINNPDGFLRCWEYLGGKFIDKLNGKHGGEYWKQKVLDPKTIEYLQNPNSEKSNTIKIFCEIAKITDETHNKNEIANLYINFLLRGVLNIKTLFTHIESFADKDKLDYLDEFKEKLQDQLSLKNTINKIKKHMVNYGANFHLLPPKTWIKLVDLIVEKAFPYDFINEVSENYGIYPLRSHEIRLYAVLFVAIYARTTYGDAAKDNFKESQGFIYNAIKNHDNESNNNAYFANFPYSVVVELFKTEYNSYSNLSMLDETKELMRNIFNYSIEGSRVYTAQTKNNMEIQSIIKNKGSVDTNGINRIKALLSENLEGSLDFIHLARFGEFKWEDLKIKLLRINIKFKTVDSRGTRSRLIDTNIPAIVIGIEIPSGTVVYFIATYNNKGWFLGITPEEAIKEIIDKRYDNIFPKKIAEYINQATASSFDGMKEIIVENPKLSLLEVMTFQGSQKHMAGVYFANEVIDRKRESLLRGKNLITRLIDNTLEPLLEPSTFIPLYGCVKSILDKNDSKMRTFITCLDTPLVVYPAYKSIKKIIDGCQKFRLAGYSSPTQAMRQASFSPRAYIFSENTGVTSVIESELLDQGHVSGGTFGYIQTTQTRRININQGLFDPFSSDLPILSETHSIHLEETSGVWSDFTLSSSSANDGALFDLYITITNIDTTRAGDIESRVAVQNDSPERAVHRSDDASAEAWRQARTRALSQAIDGFTNLIDLFSFNLPTIVKTVVVIGKTKAMKIIASTIVIFYSIKITKSALQAIEDEIKHGGWRDISYKDFGSLYNNEITKTPDGTLNNETTSPSEKDLEEFKKNIIPYLSVDIIENRFDLTQEEAHSYFIEKVSIELDLAIRAITEKAGHGLGLETRWWHSEKNLGINITIIPLDSGIDISPEINDKYKFTASVSTQNITFPVYESGVVTFLEEDVERSLVPSILLPLPERHILNDILSPTVERILFYLNHYLEYLSFVDDKSEIQDATVEESAMPVRWKRKSQINHEQVTIITDMYGNDWKYLPAKQRSPLSQILLTTSNLHIIRFSYDTPLTSVYDLLQKNILNTWGVDIDELLIEIVTTDNGSTKDSSLPLMSMKFKDALHHNGIISDEHEVTLFFPCHVSKKNTPSALVVFLTQILNTKLGAIHHAIEKEFILNVKPRLFLGFIPASSGNTRHLGYYTTSPLAPFLSLVERVFIKSIVERFDIEEHSLLNKEILVDEIITTTPNTKIQKRYIRLNDLIKIKKYIKSMNLSYAPGSSIEKMPFQLIKLWLSARAEDAFAEMELIEAYLAVLYEDNEFIIKYLSPNAFLLYLKSQNENLEHISNVTDIKMKLICENEIKFLTWIELQTVKNCLIAYPSNFPESMRNLLEAYRKYH